MPTPSSLTAARRRTALILRGTEMPSAFLEATLSALCNELDRGADKKRVRRLSGKVARLGLVSP